MKYYLHGRFWDRKEYKKERLKTAKCCAHRKNVFGWAPIANMISFPDDCCKHRDCKKECEVFNVKV